MMRLFSRGCIGSWLVIAGAIVGFICCAPKHSADQMTGVWVMPIVGMEGVQGMALNKDGTASSVNMATLKYDEWRICDESLILSGTSIGNGVSFRFTDTLNIVRVDADSLILSKGDSSFGYARRRE